MSKNKRTLIILISIVLVIAIGITVILLTSPKDATSSEEEAETINIYSIPAADFLRATVTNVNGGFTLEKTDDSFTIPEDEGYTLNSYSIGWISEKLVAPNASKAIETPNNLSEYGLDKPTATCKVESKDGSVRTLLLGNATPSSGYYMMLEGETTVYVVIHNLPAYLTNSAAWYVDTDVIPTADDYDEDTDTTVTYVYLGGKARDEEVEITMDPNYVATDNEASTPYVMTKPIEYAVNSSTAGELISYAPGVSFSECADIRITPEKLASYGLDNPDYILRYKFAKSDVTIRFAQADGFCYAYLEGFSGVFKAYSTSTDFLKTPAEDYMSRLTFSKSLSVLKTMKVSANGKSYEFKITHTDDDIVPFYGSLQLYTDNFKQFYENMLMTLSEGRTTDKPSASAYLTIEYTFTDGSPNVKVEYVPVDSMRYLYLIDGDGTFFVLKSQVDAIISDVEKLSKNETIKTTI